MHTCSSSRVFPFIQRRPSPASVLGRGGSVRPSGASSTGQPAPTDDLHVFKFLVMLQGSSYAACFQICCMFNTLLRVTLAKVSPLTVGQGSPLTTKGFDQKQATVGP